jgi:hypothetical protein
MITFVLWKWRDKKFRETYTAAHVNAMAEMIGRRVSLPHRIVCVTDDPVGLAGGVGTFPLWTDCSSLRNASGPHLLPSCYRRLKIFDGATTDAMGIARGERVVSLDLDAVIVSDAFGQLFEREETFVGWGVPGHRHLLVFNGSMFMHRAGSCEKLWTDFDPHTSPRLAVSRGFLGSDQAWLSLRMLGRPDVGIWTSRQHGVKRMREVRDARCFSEKDTSVVFFPGNDKPWHPEIRRRYAWIDRHAAYEEGAAEANPGREGYI